MIYPFTFILTHVPSNDVRSHLQWHLPVSGDVFIGARAGHPVTHSNITQSNPDGQNQARSRFTLYVTIEKKRLSNYL